MNSIRLEGCNQGYAIDENEYGANDMEKGLLLDNGEFSSTRGQPMKFVDNLNTKIINAFIRMWNQADLQRQLLEEWRHQRELIVSDINPQSVLDAKEFVFDLSRQLTPLLDNENYSAYTRHFNMNVNREQIFSSKEADSLQRTLYVFLNVDYEINSPEELDLDSLLIPIIDITKINDFFSSDKPRDSSIPQYIYYIGYPAIIYEDTINRTVYELTGKKDVFKAVETKRLEPGIFVDRALQGFIFGTPDGEWIPVNSGVILLNQNKEGNQLRLTLIKYKPTEIYEKVYVEGEYNGEDQLYQLISMKKVE